MVHHTGYGYLVLILVLCLRLCLINDGDVISKGVQLSFVETNYTVYEDEGVQHVCVELTGELSTSVSVTVHTQPSTALGMHSVWYNSDNYIVALRC